MLIYYTLCPSASKIVQVEGRITREQNIQDKHVYVLATKGREISYIHKTIANRARAMQEFQGRDFSMVLDLLEQAGV
jgi:ERCC4-related helicase